jgi:hypothetical protein
MKRSAWAFAVLSSSLFSTCHRGVRRWRPPKGAIIRHAERVLPTTLFTPGTPFLDMETPTLELLLCAAALHSPFSSPRRKTAAGETGLDLAIPIFE